MQNMCMATHDTIGMDNQPIVYVQIAFGESTYYCPLTLPQAEYIRRLSLRPLSASNNQEDQIRESVLYQLEAYIYDQDQQTVDQSQMLNVMRQLSRHALNNATQPNAIDRQQDLRTQIINQPEQPAAPKLDVFAGSDPQSHIGKMFEAIRFIQSNLQDSRENKQQFLNTLERYLNSNFMPENRSYIMINDQRVSRRQNFIDRMLECMKTVFDHGNEALFTLSSTIQAANNPPDLHNAIMDVSDYIKRLESQSLQIQKKVKMLKFAFCKDQKLSEELAYNIATNLSLNDYKKL